MTNKKPNKKQALKRKQSKPQKKKLGKTKDQSQEKATQKNALGATQYEDLEPLLEQLPAYAAESPEATQHALYAAIDNDMLVDEPELGSIESDPIDAAETFVEANIKLGFTAEMAESLSDFEYEAANLLLYQTTTDALLTDAIKTSILQALKKMQKRFRREDNRLSLARAVGLTSMLEEADGELDKWRNFEFMHAFFGRRVEIGFLVDEVAEQMDSSFGLETDEIKELLLMLEDLLEKTPGARKALSTLQ